VRLLPDTHALVWFAFADPQLSTTARLLLADPANEILVSPASYWEIAIKVSLGKWALQRPYSDMLDALWNVYGFRILHITPEHTTRLLTLPHPANHRDPFDRLLIAQALVEGVPLVSADAKLDQYGVNRIWV
jgi:PIN domain nuclease of toxin-antitoxin system